MECFEKPVWMNLTEDRICQMKIEVPSREIYKKVKSNWDQIAKPLDGMGKFETIIAKIGAIQRTERFDIKKKVILIFCADNGVVEEGISQSGQDVTLAVMKNMAKKSSAVGKMATYGGIETVPIDIGVNTEEEVPQIVQKKIRKGTRNFAKEYAMTKEEVLQAIAIGIEMVEVCQKKGFGLIGTGEMGIGNTTTSSAITAALLGCKAECVTGRGAGLENQKLEKKCALIQSAIETYDLYHANAFRILQAVGGLDIAALVGVCIGGALYHVPIMLDGVISLAAAFVAEKMVPGIKSYVLASHKGKEPAMEKLMQALDLDPILDAELALGEGTGAVMGMELLDMALTVYESSSTFSVVGVEQYKRYEYGDDGDHRRKR